MMQIQGVYLHIISFKSNFMHRQTDRQTQAITNASTTAYMEVILTTYMIAPTI